MLFIHTSDLHIGDGSKLIPLLYLDRQREMLDHIFTRISKRHKVDMVGITGDVYHTKNPTTEERDLLLEYLLKADNSNVCKFIIIPGNHDKIREGLTNVGSMSLLQNAGKLKNTIICETPRVVKIKQGYVICIPYGFNIKREYKRLLASIEGKRREFLILFAHGRVQGAMSDSGRILGGGVPLTSIKGTTYIGLGDMHAFQRIRKNTYYSGAPIQHTFKDTLPKGVLLVDTNSPDTPKLIPIPVQPMVTIKYGDEIPKDCLVRVLASKNVEQALPDNVIKVASFWEVDDSEEDIWFPKGSLSKGLYKFMLSKGYSKKDAKLAKIVVNKMCDRGT